MSALKPKIRRVPTTGLHWTHQYANVGDKLVVWPITGGVPVVVEVKGIKRNRYGRVSYVTDLRPIVMTEELTPRGHLGCTA